jgi:hypothetical protein
VRYIIRIRLTSRDNNKPLEQAMSSKVWTFLVVAISFIAMTMTMVMYTKQREIAFLDRQEMVDKAIVHGTAFAVSEQVLQEQRNVQLFADEYRELITRLAQYPTDKVTRSSLKHRLQQRFPDSLTFTMTNAQGITILSDVDLLVGKVCRREISDYYKLAKSAGIRARNPVVIHPQPGHYHYDVMAQVGDIVFFVSILPRAVAELLRNHQVPGHELMLVKKQDLSLIEIASKGVRDVLVRDVRLSQKESERIRVAESVKGTEWRLIDLPELQFEEEYQRQLWKEASVVLMILALAGFLMMMLVWRSDAPR